ncbi:LrgB family protein [Parablautia muri]|uniref:LrgB family protein n=1 Tax=Parablautia muri TaxID=2320879 RepID=A0A9X5GRS8_9FIRM|nr:LrgB family protein [Parablautia muri]NBJ91377.1 LrgB family protein [Parablautia muri]
MDMFTETVCWGLLISVGSYILCDYIQRKKHFIFFNPLLFSTIFSILFLIIFKIDYEDYYNKSDYLYYLLSPATVCLAVPLYEQINVLKKNIQAVCWGIISGVLASMGSILVFSIMFGFSHTMYVTLLPKSITAAIAMGVSEEMGGISSLTVPIVIMTGITGHMVSEKVCKIFKITDPIAKGIAIGSASHAMGTTKAIEMGEVEGAMSSLSIAVAGIITVICSFVFVHFY